MNRLNMANDPYYIDFSGRIRSIQKEMAEKGLAAYAMRKAGSL